MRLRLGEVPTPKTGPFQLGSSIRFRRFVVGRPVAAGAGFSRAAVSAGPTKIVMANYYASRPVLHFGFISHS